MKMPTYSDRNKKARGPHTDLGPPVWHALCKTFIQKIPFQITNLWRGTFKKSTLEIIRELTSDKDLQTVFSYCWGDYGTPPSDSHFLIQVTSHALDF